MTTAIAVHRIGKCYEVAHLGARGGYQTLRESLTEGGRSLAARLLGRRKTMTRETFWALKDLDLEIDAGDVVGIIGHNGAGKSTLLKILSEITKPTTGRVDVRGRVSSLLEVGTGFHPELTGRENIYLNGSILGMSRREIARRFDEIVAFSEVEKFLDTPVKRYSSGMYVRLAFGVAAHLEPEILLVDEVLAVGDASFQKKCLGKIQAVTSEGRTVLFVSHNMGSINNLCRRVIWLDRGRVKDQGPAKSIIDKYMSDTAIAKDRQVVLSGFRPTLGSFDNLTLHSLEWLSEMPPRHGGALKFRIHFEAHRDIEGTSFGLGLCSIDGTRLLSLDSDDGGLRPRLGAFQRGCVELAIDELPLTPGVYSLDIGGRSGDRHCLSFLRGFALIEVLAGPRTPAMYACFTGSGVRISPACRWGEG